MSIQRYTNRGSLSHKSRTSAPASTRSVSVTSVPNPYAPVTFTSKQPISRVTGINPTLKAMHVQFTPAYQCLPSLPQEPEVHLSEEVIANLQRQ